MLGCCKARIINKYHLAYSLFFGREENQGLSMKKILLGLLLIFLSVSLSAAEEIKLEEVSDFQQLAEKMKKEKLVLVLEFHAENCAFCKQLEEEILIPMLYSGDYNDLVLIRQLALDSKTPVKGFDGKMTSGVKLGKAMNIIVTPTLVFLDATGKEISERIVGINTPEMFSAYVDAAIEEGQQAISGNKKVPSPVVK